MTTDTHIELQSNEGVILKSSECEVICGSERNPSMLVLTNLNLIFVRRKSFGNKVLGYLTIPLADIKVVNGKVQALPTNSNRGYRLEVYLKSGNMESFMFRYNSKKDAVRWAIAISQALGIDSNEGVGVDSTNFALPGSKSIAEALKGTVDTFKSVFAQQTEQDLEKLRKSVYCMNCGANYVAIKGRIGKCPYCGTTQEIK